MMKTPFTFSPFHNFVRKIATTFMFVATLVLFGNVANASKRVALVIGNSAYQHAPTLKNPRNDAEDLASLLGVLGFEVVSGMDLSSRGMRAKVREFGIKLRNADVGLFFYAGHAMQVNGRNYLAPVDTNIQFESDLDFETIPMDFIQRQIERETKTTLLFLDACRNNPLLNNLKGKSRALQATRGLAREVNSSEGTFISFATQPDNVALDGAGRNSPFTKALLDNLGRPDIEISTLMTDVRRQVFEATGEQQIPWINSSLLGRFYFKGGDTGSKFEAVASLDDIKKIRTDNSPKPEPVNTFSANNNSNSGNSSVSRKNNKTDELLAMRLEQLAWEAIKDSQDVDELRAFINAYGSGFFGDLAKLRLARIEKEKASELANLDNGNSSRKIEVEQVLRDKPEGTSESANLENSNLDDGEQKIVTRETTRLIQGELNRIGCVAGATDGIWGRKSIRALNAYSKYAKVRLASIRPTHDLLRQLKTYTSRICPARKRVVKRRPVSCQPGQRISSRGNCYWPNIQRGATCQPGQQLSGDGTCYWPIQQQPGQFGQPGVIVQQPQPGVIIQQPQPQPNPGNLGAAIGGIILKCKLQGTC